MEKREIEVTVISAEGLRINRKQAVKKNAFVIVRSDPYNCGSTGMDREGGSYPAWNEKLPLHLPSDARFITVEAHSGSKLIGTANIPVSDFAGGFLPENYLSFLSYRLRDANGEKNGIVNLSVQTKGRPRWEWDNGNKNKGIVTGIPVQFTAKSNV